MSSSGISVNEEAVKQFNLIKSGKKIRYCEFRISREMEVSVGEVVQKPKDFEVSPEGVKKEWDTFCSKLSSTECYFIVYDMDFEMKGGARREKLCLITWCPGDSNVRDKMICSSTSNAVKDAFSGIQVSIEANDLEDLVFTDIQQKIEK